MTIVIKGFHGTRLSEDRRVVFDGICEGNLVLASKTANIFNDSGAVHHTVKGLFKAYPRLITASLQEVALEVAVQLGTKEAILDDAGISEQALVSVMRSLSRYMPISLISKAVSRMKQHDRDLANDPDTKQAIAAWRKDNHQPGNPDKRVATRMQSLWANRASNAVHQIEEANALKQKHAKYLSEAPVLSVCEVKGKNGCVEFTAQMVKNLFPGVK